jgi:hypothetical protein
MTAMRRTGAILAPLILAGALAAACDGFLSVRGRVVRASGVPASGVEVVAYASGNAGAERVVSTDQRGCFVLEAVCRPTPHEVPLSIRVSPGDEVRVTKLTGPNRSGQGPSQLIRITLPERDASVVAAEPVARLDECAIADHRR